MEDPRWVRKDEKQGEREKQIAQIVGCICERGRNPGL